MYEEFFSAFWLHIINRLKAGDVETRLWLDTRGEVGGFEFWCDMSGKDIAWWRQRLMRAWVSTVPSGEKKKKGDN